MATPLRSCGAYRLCGGIPLRKPPRRLTSRPNRTAFGRPSFDCAPDDRRSTAFRWSTAFQATDCEAVGRLTSA